ncbi:hypothetical protein J3A83DRAFT_4369466 [Scleroderma citrinum]
MSQSQAPLSYNSPLPLQYRDWKTPSPTPTPPPVAPVPVMAYLRPGHLLQERTPSLVSTRPNTPLVLSPPHWSQAQPTPDILEDEEELDPNDFISDMEIRLMTEHILHPQPEQEDFSGIWPMPNYEVECPYSHPAASISGASLRSNHSHISSTFFMKKSLSEGHDAISKKLKELNGESDLYCEDLEDAQTHHAALQYNYAIQSKELELQQEKFNAQCVTAELSFCQEHNLKKLDLKLKKAEENALSQQITLVCLQIALKGMDQAAQTSTSNGSTLSLSLFTLPPSG